MQDVPLSPPSHLLVDFFDGQSSRPRSARLGLSGQQVQAFDVEDGSLLASCEASQIQWPERMRYGARMAHWPGGQSMQVAAENSHVWDAWVQAHVRSDSLVVRAQQSWRAVMFSMVLVVVAVVAGYIWGLPAAARAVVGWVPESIDQSLGEQTMRQIDGDWMAPSKLSPEVQARLRERFAQGVRQAYGTDAPEYRLEFRQSKIGPNAFALPGGTMVMTDELVELVKDDEVVLGVLGHELGHVAQRHGMRQLVQFGLMQAALGVVFGDYGSWLTTAPLILGTMGYSRDHEREADQAAISFMQGAGISPKVMVKFFAAVRGEQAKRAAQEEEKDKEKGKAKPLPIGIGIIASHPHDAERIAVFEAAAK
jgi:Zn-dependent protease with chaperone function